MSSLPDAGVRCLNGLGAWPMAQLDWPNIAAATGPGLVRILRSGAARNTANVTEGLLCVGFAEFWSLDPAVAP